MNKKELIEKVYSLENRLYKIESIKEPKELIKLYIDLEEDIEIVVEGLDKYKEAEECREVIKGLREYKLEAQRRRLRVTYSINKKDKTLDMDC